MSDFPPVAVTELEDAKYFSENLDDPALRVDYDGGYQATRPRYTRAPRRTWTTGFTLMGQTEYEACRTFYESRKGGSESFTWTNPADGVEYTVRFQEFSPEYIGPGPGRRFNLKIKLKQV